MKHASSSFLTLTYDDDHLPDGHTLDPDDTKNFLKRFRAAIEPQRVRYFLVGEYGDESQRPHYHAALFGFACAGRKQKGFDPRCYCENCEIVRKTWSKGNISLDDLTSASAQYIAGYVLKKMTKWEDPRLHGRHPEFARMSLRPGIGADAMDDVTDALCTVHGMDLLEVSGDAPTSLQHGSRSLPLGRYLRNKLREKIGIPEEHKEFSFYKYSSEMCDLFKTALSDPKNKTKGFKQILIDQNLQRVRNIEGRQRLYKGNKSL